MTGNRQKILIWVSLGIVVLLWLVEQLWFTPDPVPVPLTWTPTATVSPTWTPTATATPSVTASPTWTPITVPSATDTAIPPVTAELTETPVPPLSEQITLTWYDYQDQRTACGQEFDGAALTVAAPVSMGLECGEEFALCYQGACVQVQVSDVMPQSSADRYGGRALDGTSAVLAALGILHGYNQDGIPYGRALVELRW